MWLTVTLAINQMASPPNAAQCNTSATVVTNDNALLSASFREGSPGYLWVSGNDACTFAGDNATYSCARFIQIAITNDDVGTAKVSQDFDVGQDGFIITIRPRHSALMATWPQSSRGRRPRYVRECMRRSSSQGTRRL